MQNINLKMKNFIKSRRVENNLTQAEVATGAGFSKSKYIRMENIAHQQKLTIEDIQVLKDYYHSKNISFDVIIAFEFFADKKNIRARVQRVDNLLNSIISGQATNRDIEEQAKNLKAEYIAVFQYLEKQ